LRLEAHQKQFLVFQYLPVYYSTGEKLTERSITVVYRVRDSAVWVRLPALRKNGGL
jgi:hypothetical protein